MAEAEANTEARRSYGDTPIERGAPQGSVAQHSNSTPSNQRVIDYSPSPEDTKGVAAASTNGNGNGNSNGEARQGMKVTLKRNSHANGKEPSW